MQGGSRGGGGGGGGRGRARPYFGPIFLKCKTGVNLDSRAPPF